MSDSPPLAHVRWMTDCLHLARKPTIPPSDLRWETLVAHADAHSLTPMLCDIWDATGVLAGAPASVAARIRQARADNMARQGNVRNDFLQVAELLADEGIDFIVLKGWWLVETAYSHPAHRVMYDLDFLVPPSLAQRAHAMLQHAGYVPLPKRDAWVEKHLPSLWRNHGYQWNGYLFDPNYPRPVELHTQLWEQHWRGLSLVNLPDVWRRTLTRTVASVRVRVLDNEIALAHLAMHFAGHLVEGEARLNQLLDLARLVSGGNPLDWQEIERVALSCHAGRFVYAALLLAHRIFGSDLPPSKVWEKLSASAPPRWRAWLERDAEAEVLTSNYRRRDMQKQYRLTLLAAQNFAEAAGVLRFAALPPAGQLLSKYNATNRWLLPLLYPRHFAERLASLGRK